MDLTAIGWDDDAVSPVIGVILMVAITVIVAALAGSYALAFSEQTQQTTPQASFEFEWDGDASPSGELYSGGDGGELTIRHVGGDTIENARLTIVDDDSGSTAVTAPFATEVTAGMTETVDADADDKIRIIYTGNSDKDPVSVTGVRRTQTHGSKETVQRRRRRLTGYRGHPDGRDYRDSGGSNRIVRPRAGRSSKSIDADGELLIRLPGSIRYR